MKRSDITFISLQYGETATDLAVIDETTGRVVHHWPDAMADYDETAALVAALDMVITVQTAAAHLAGALGRPVWIILPASPEWRYTASGASLPWYPSAELFRQRHVGEWGEVIAAVSSALDKAYPLPGSITTG
jgi:ADP-heptose:LPS heptosyltransferase